MSVISMQKVGEQPTLKEGITLFMRKCKVKNLSSYSIESYEQKLNPFCEYLGTDFLLTDISITTVEDFILWLRDNRTCGDITINSYLRSVRAFLYFCMDAGYTKRFKVQLIKADKPIKPTYSDSELEKLLIKPDMNNCSFSEYRTWVFENFLLGSGARLRTALNVHISDVSFEDMTILYRKQKSRKQAIIPLSRSLGDVLMEYLEIRGGEPEDFLFCNNYGEQGDSRVYQQLVHDYNIKRGVTKTGVHIFRHTFARNWVQSGGDVFRLQKILGHSTLAMTREYVNLFGQDLQMDYEKYCPLDRLTKKRTRISF